MTMVNYKNNLMKKIQNADALIGVIGLGYVGLPLHTRQWPEAPVLKSQPLTEKNITTKDAVIIITDHTSVDYKLIAKHAKLIIDSRGVYRKPMKNVVKA